MREPVFIRSHSGEDLYAMAYMQHQREPGLRHVRSEPHISPTDVETVLSGLAENTVIVLPRTCCEAAGLAPNINDKQQPKHLWVGRLKHLNRMLSATSLQQAVQPQEVRRSFLQAALDEVECRRPSDAEIPMQLAQLPGWKLQQMAHAAIVIQKMWRGRRARQANSLDVLKAFSACITKGTVVYLCGSTGLAGDSLRYVRMLAGLGYLVIAPDALAGTSPLRHRRPRLILRPDQATDYWERNLLYEDDGAEGELVYVSTSEGVLASPDHFDQVFNNIITVRQAELAFTLRRLPAFIKRQGVFLFGMSEGAVTLSTFNDEYFASMVRGRVLASYSCECNYWNYNRPEDVGIAGSADIPTLNLMGFEDEYFGVHNSVAATVAAYGGYPPIAGHAFQPMMERGIQWGLACHFEGGHHSLLLSHDDVIREILSDFLVRPLTTCRSLAVLWGNLPDLQDEITRVRRSADEKVLYVRIRPSPGPVSPPLAAKQSSRLEALLDALSARLYEVENSDGTAHPGAPNWSELHLTPPHSPQTSGGASGLPAGLRPGAASPLGGHSPIASSPEGATPTFAAGLDKSKARAATARLLAHFALRNATQPDSLVPQSSLPAGSSPLGSARGSLSAASAPPGPSTATTPSSSSSGLADTPTAASTPAGVVMLTAGVAAMREGPGQEQQQFSGQHYSAATVAQSAGLAGEGRCAAGLEAQDGSAPAATPTSPGSQRGSSQLLTGTEGGSGVRLGIPQQQVVVGNCGGERASSPPTQPGGSLVVSALSAALRGSSTGGLGCAPALPNGMAEQEASSNEMAVAVISGADAASHPTVEGGRQPAAMVAADTAGDGLPTASLGLSASPSHVHTRPHPDVLANGRHGPPLDAAAGAAAELHFSPVQKLLAASLATEQQLSPSSSPPRSGRSGASWQQPRPLNSAGRGPGHYYARSYSGRSLAAAAAASAAALGVASAEQQQEEFEAGLETLQDWMISQGAQPSSPGKPRSPQRGSRPPSARSTDSMRRPPRSVHFSEQEEPRPPRSCDAGWGSFAGGSEGVTDEGSGSDLGTEEEESTIERSPSLAVDLQKLCRAMAFQTEAVTKATEALASTAQAASWVAAGSLAVLVLLSIVIVARP